MNQEIIPPDEGGERAGQHLVDVVNLPASALSAILNKLDEKSQRSTRVFKEDFFVNISDVKNLLEKLHQELEGPQSLSESVKISLFLSTNQRYDFSSWRDFEGFDKTKPERTKSLLVQYTRNFAASDGTLERYQVQLSIQNLPGRYHIFIGPVTFGRIEDAGIPPFPIHATVDYTSYIRGKNLISTIDGWVESLDVQDRKIIRYLQEHSRKILYSVSVLVTLSALIGCVTFSPSEGASVRDLGLFVGYSAIFVFLSHNLGKLLANLIDYNIDNNFSESAITLTRGDEKRNSKIKKRNAKLLWRAGLFVFAAIMQISCSLAASYILYNFFSLP